MKIFNVEDDKQVVYLCSSDLEMIDTCIRSNPRIHVPQEYYEQVSVDNMDASGYIRLTATPVIEFIKSIDWIIDYDLAMQMSDDYLNFERQDTLSKIEALRSRIAGLNPEKFVYDRKKKKLLARIKLYEYKVLSINTIMGIRDGECEIKLPLVRKSNSFAVICGDYIIYNSLSYGTIMVSRTDGEPISNVEDIPERFINSALPIIAHTSKFNSDITKYYEAERRLTDDRRSWVLVYKKSPNELDINKRKKYVKSAA